MIVGTSKREPPEEAETPGGGWGVVRAALTNFLEVKIFNKFDASRRLSNMIRSRVSR